MSKYILYSDKDQNEMALPDLDEDITPEVGDKYLHASLMLLLGSQMMHGTIIAQKQNSDDNPISCWLDNQITHSLYDMEFLDGEIALHTANMIEQATYAQCDVNGNK